MSEIDVRFPYTDGDFESRPSHDLRVGDFIGGRGPAGSHRWLAREVVYVGTGTLFGEGGYATYLTTDHAPDARPVVIMDKTVSVLRGAARDEQRFISRITSHAGGNCACMTCEPEYCYTCGHFDRWCVCPTPVNLVKAYCGICRVYGHDEHDPNCPSLADVPF